jgi:hypothetical protein
MIQFFYGCIFAGMIMFLHDSKLYDEMKEVRGSHEKHELINGLDNLATSPFIIDIDNNSDKDNIANVEVI